MRTGEWCLKGGRGGGKTQDVLGKGGDDMFCWWRFFQIFWGFWGFLNPDYSGRSSKRFCKGFFWRWDIKEALGNKEGVKA